MKNSTDVWTVSDRHGIAASSEKPLAHSNQNLPSFKPYSTAFDVAIGTANGLIAAGLVALHELPGQLGRNRFMCTYPPDGNRVHRKVNAQKSTCQGVDVSLEAGLKNTACKLQLRKTRDKGDGSNNLIGVERFLPKAPGRLLQRTTIAFE